MATRIFIISPVRNITPEQAEKIKNYVLEQEAKGKLVYSPARDTDQKDDVGYKICTANCQAVKCSDEVHVFWYPGSEGSLFDLGMAFALNKPIVLVNPEDIIPIEGKSFTNMVCFWSFVSENVIKDED